MHERFGKQVKVCGVPGLPVVGPDGVTTGGMLRIRRKGSTAFPADVSTCGSVLCPVCGPKIRARRAEDFTAAIGRWFARGPDHDGWFVTLNARNEVGLSEADAVDRALKGWQRLRNRKPWRRLASRYGLHYIKALDVTHGENGWNVHLHIALMTAREQGDCQVMSDLFVALRRLWPDVMGRLGFYADPRQVHIEQVDASTAAGIGGYLAKESAWGIGDELARLDLKQGKTGRTYEQIVADYDEHGRDADLALIHEHHEALYGRRSFSWSQGFRELLGMAAEQTDDEAAAEPAEADDVAVVDGRVYYTMLRRHQVPGLLDVADHGDYVGVREYVAGLGYRPDVVWAPRPDLTCKRPPRDKGGGARYSRTEWADANERHHEPLAEVHRLAGPVAGCVCEACRS